MAKKVGYARVSTADQNLDLQFDALKRADCDQVFADKASGASVNRPELVNALATCNAGDVLVVWKLDRLGRSLRDLVEIVAKLGERGIGFVTLQDGIDTTTTGGRLVFHIFCALAQAEREQIRDRTLAGLAAARARGRRGGRPRLLDQDKIAVAIRLLEAGATREDAASCVGVSVSTLGRRLKARNDTPRGG